MPPQSERNGGDVGVDRIQVRGWHRGDEKIDDVVTWTRRAKLKDSMEGSLWVFR
jgi:hypothetical protein